jgi:hypothetical protein
MRMHVNLPVSFLKEGKSFVAYTPALDLSTSGKTLAEAERRFADAVGVFFEELHRMGTLDEVLRDLGWVKVKREWRSPMPVAHRTTKLCVPA